MSWHFGLPVELPQTPMWQCRVIRQFRSFAGVGLAGLAVDVAIFFAVSGYLAWPVHWARMASVLCSITTTWALNRRFTFRDQTSRNKRAEYLRYLFVQAVGLSVNLGVFTICLATAPVLRRNPLIALLIGAAAALIFNFLTARAVAFRVDAGR